MKEKSIIYPQVSPESWAEKYDLVISEHICEKCGKILIPSIPFATVRWRGLVSPQHECGEVYDYSIARELQNGKDTSWKEVYHILDLVR